VRADQEELAAATDLYHQALALCRQAGDKDSVARALVGLARVAWGNGDAARAATLLGAVDALRAAIGVSVEPIDRAQQEQLAAALHAALGDLPFAAASGRGHALSMDDAIELAAG